MTYKPISILRLVLLALVCTWAGQAHAARWEDHRAAALRAVDEIDYPKAIEQFEAAIYYARETPAADRDIADLWENLTAAYFADEQYRRVWHALARWDSILTANAGQAWVPEQQTRRDRMARLLFEETRRARDETAAAEP
jgi:tetratricopeptide (TPR) repeat protein